MSWHFHLILFLQVVGSVYLQGHKKDIMLSSSHSLFGNVSLWGSFSDTLMPKLNITLPTQIHGVNITYPKEMQQILGLFDAKDPGDMYNMLLELEEGWHLKIMPCVHEDGDDDDGHFHEEELEEAEAAIESVSTL